METNRPQKSDCKTGNATLNNETKPVDASYFRAPADARSSDWQCRHAMSYKILKSIHLLDEHTNHQSANNTLKLFTERCEQTNEVVLSGCPES